MVHQAVDDRVGEHGVGEHLPPSGQRLVGRHHDRPLLVSSGHELEEQLGDRLVDREIAYFVDDEQFVFVEVAHRVFLPVLRRGLLQPADEVAEMDEVGRHVAARRLDADAGGQMGLADAGAPDEEDVVAVLQEAEGPQFGYGGAVDGGLVVEVEVAQGLPVREIRQLEVHLCRALVPEAYLHVGQFPHHLRRRLGRRRGVLHVGWQVLHDLRQAQLREVGLQFRVFARFHGRPLTR